MMNFLNMEQCGREYLILYKVLKQVLPVTALTQQLNSPEKFKLVLGEKKYLIFNFKKVRNNY